MIASFTIQIFCISWRRHRALGFRKRDELCIGPSSRLPSGCCSPSQCVWRSHPLHSYSIRNHEPTHLPRSCSLLWMAQCSPLILPAFCMKPLDHCEERFRRQTGKRSRVVQRFFQGSCLRADHKNLCGRPFSTIRISPSRSAMSCAKTPNGWRLRRVSKSNTSAISRAKCMAVVVADPRIASSAAGSIDEMMLIHLFCKIANS